MKTLWMMLAGLCLVGFVEPGSAIATPFAGDLGSRTGPWFGTFDEHQTRVSAYGFGGQLKRMSDVALDDEPTKRVKPGDPRLPASMANLRQLQVVTPAGPQDLKIRYFLARRGGSLTILEMVLEPPSLPRRIRAPGRSGPVVAYAGRALPPKGRKNARWGNAKVAKLSDRAFLKVLGQLSRSHHERAKADPELQRVSFKGVSRKHLAVFRLEGRGRSVRRVIVVRKKVAPERFVGGMVVVDAAWRVKQEVVPVADRSVFYTISESGDVDGDGDFEVRLEGHFLDRTDASLCATSDGHLACQTVESDGG